MLLDELFPVLAGSLVSPVFTAVHPIGEVLIADLPLVDGDAEAVSGKVSAPHVGASVLAAGLLSVITLKQSKIAREPKKFLTKEAPGGGRSLTPLTGVPGTEAQ